MNNNKPPLPPKEPHFLGPPSKGTLKESMTVTLGTSKSGKFYRRVFSELPLVQVLSAKWEESLKLVNAPGPLLTLSLNNDLAILSLFLDCMTKKSFFFLSQNGAPHYEDFVNKASKLHGQLK